MYIPYQSADAVRHAVMPLHDDTEVNPVQKSLALKDPNI
jgi:hypothetical protein